MTLIYSTVIVRERGGFWAYVPDLPGVYGRGNTKSQAKKDLVEALTLYVEDCRADGDPIPRSAAKIVDVDRVRVAA